MTRIVKPHIVAVEIEAGQARAKKMTLPKACGVFRFAVRGDRGVLRVATSRRDLRDGGNFATITPARCFESPGDSILHSQVLFVCLETDDQPSGPRIESLVLECIAWEGNGNEK